MVSDKKILSCFSLKAYVKHVTPRWGYFWPQAHNLNKFGRGPLRRCYIPNIKVLGPVALENKIFKVFILKIYL